jgi:hypothetical protein
MSKYDINQILLKLSHRPPATRKPCQFDGKTDLIGNVLKVELKEGSDVPNAPVVFRCVVTPIVTFGPWRSWLAAEFNATDQTLIVEPNYDCDDHMQEAYLLYEDLGPDFANSWDGFLNHFHFSQTDLRLIEDAIRRFIGQS